MKKNNTEVINICWLKNKEKNSCLILLNFTSKILRKLNFLTENF